MYLIPNSYFASPVLAFAFSFGEGDAAGDWLAAGLGLTTGAGTVGDAVVVAGVAAAGVFELFSGSVAQPAAKAIESVATRASAQRLIKFTFEVVIGFSSFRKIVKRDDDCSRANL